MEHENLLPKRQILIFSAQNELFLVHTGITLRASWSDYGFPNQRMSYYNPQLLDNLAQIAAGTAGVGRAEDCLHTDVEVFAE